MAKLTPPQSAIARGTVQCPTQTQNLTHQLVARPPSILNGTINPTNHHQPLPLGVCGWGGVYYSVYCADHRHPYSCVHHHPPTYSKYLHRGWSLAEARQASHLYACLIPPPSSWRALSHGRQAGRQVQNRLPTDSIDQRVNTSVPSPDYAYIYFQLSASVRWYSGAVEVMLRTTKSLVRCGFVDLVVEALAYSFLGCGYCVYYWDRKCFFLRFLLF